MRQLLRALRVMLSFSACVAAAGQTRIVTLGPCATEHLCLLDLEKEIVGLTLHDRPQRTAGKEIVGTLLEPNIEKIVSLRPDVVVASKEGNRPEIVAKLRALGIEVFVMEEFSSFEDICRTFETLGRRFGREQRAKEIVAAEKRRLEELCRRFSRQKRPGVFFCLGWRPLITIGGKTYLDELLAAAGGRNVFGALGRKYVPVSIEEVIRRKPDAVIILAMDTGEESAMRDALRQLSAVASGRTLSVDPFPFGSPTPRSFVDSVEQLGRFLVALPRS